MTSKQALLLQLTEALLRIPSVTPQDAGCQTVLADRLTALGFTVHSLPHQETANFWAIRGSTRPVFVFAGHTDVVTTGAIEQWNTPPFEPTIENDRLYGRGAADMKGSLAAMIIATEQYLTRYPQSPGSIGFLITSAEEGPSEQGTPVVLEYLAKIGQAMDYCLVGEPSSHHQLGDTIKNGRRGSLSGRLTILGKQGHIAYPELADNPIHRAFSALDTLCKISWDEGNADFSPTQFQISNIHGGTGAGNVIPAELVVSFNFRYCPETTYQQLQERVIRLLQEYELRYQLDWVHYGTPYFTQPGRLIEATAAAITQHCHITPQLSTYGGTSDGRYIAHYCPQVIEFGPCNQTIHQVNEYIDVNDLYQLADIYENILVRIFGMHTEAEP